MNNNHKIFLFLMLLLFLLPCMGWLTSFNLIPEKEDSISVTLNGSKRFQHFDGIGVNANTASWNDDELKPAIDLLIDSAHMNLWRVIIESEKNWEDKNDNDNPFIADSNYYNRLYASPKFEKAWDMIAYLNHKGITGNLDISIMGRVPKWMGFETIRPGMEDEYVEMLVTMLSYARYHRHLEFGKFGPMNEPDIKNEGPTVGASQYFTIIKKLVQRMDEAGLGDVKIVSPDAASLDKSLQEYVPLLASSKDIMDHSGPLGFHSYGGLYTDIRQSLDKTPFRDKNFWITEWNAWRDGLDAGIVTAYNYSFAAECSEYLLQFLNGGASGAIVWEGYDSYYEHPPSTWSLWGILAYDSVNKIYSPRKHFYALSQFSKFVPEGSVRIGTDDTARSLPVSSFYDTRSGRISVTGMNLMGHPERLTIKLSNLPEINNFTLYVTDSLKNLVKAESFDAMDNLFSADIPAKCIFTITGIPSSGVLRPEPTGWYAGDMHVHRNCGEYTKLPDSTSILSENKYTQMMEDNNLSVISLLADMGNGEVQNPTTDLQKVNGRDAPQSIPGRIVHWDAEWHWDATYSNFSNQALGGHLVLLGLKEAHQIWDESPFKILEWARSQGAIGGFCHMEYLNDSIQNELNCCIPIDYPVEAALGTIDFVAEDVWINDAAIHAYYKLLNCGFRLGLAAGTDFPCNNSEPLGTLLTYVQVKDGSLTYDKWIDGIKEGRTVVAHGHSEFLDLKVNDHYSPGDEIEFSDPGKINVKVKWTDIKETSGRIELVYNGKVVSILTGSATPGHPLEMTYSMQVNESGWICARRMNGEGHQSHTAPVYIVYKNKPVRASSEDAEYFIKWIDNILQNIQTGGPWSRYFTHDRETVIARYHKARDIYAQILAETKNQSDR